VTVSGSIRPTFFATPDDFRRWLRKNHRTAQELWVGFYKKASGLPSITWSEAVDEALCFGWIDGVRKSVDGSSYMNRFTPRRKGSIWSEVNTRRVEVLIRQRRMRAAGLEAFAARDPARTSRYSVDRERAALDASLAARLRANDAAWRFFQAQPPGYRRTAIWFVMSARQEATRARRLEQLIADSAAGLRIGLLRRP
jgi:uncharacterized protein YdeI (YjbR/CyaY-like superfamily)